MPSIKIEHYVHENLSYLTQSRGLRVSDIARATLLPESTIKYILSGTTTNPRVETVRTLASFFGFPLDFFVNTPISNYEGELPPERSQVPLIPWDKAREWVLQQKTSSLPSTPIDILHWVPVAEHTPEGSFSLTVHQQTINTFPQHAQLIITPQESYRDEDFVISCTHDNTPVIRQILDEGSTIYLSSPRGTSAPEPLTSSHTLLGKICECRQVFA